MREDRIGRRFVPTWGHNFDVMVIGQLEHSFVSNIFADEDVIVLSTVLHLLDL